MNAYEGTEKKCEIIIDSSRLNLRCLERSFWDEMIASCGAKILSSVHNQYCDAYLLSESSLFVWEDKLLLITCGQTRLIDSVLYFLQRIDISVVSRLLFQRKNEYFSSLQSSDFTEDAQQLAQVLGAGEVILLGDPNGHFTKCFSFYGTKGYSRQEGSYELLMYDISEIASLRLMRPNQEREEIRAFLGLSEIVSDFQVDDHLFRPYGYSLNAIRDFDYISIHITPQPDHSYVSVKTSLSLSTILPQALSIFSPETFNIIFTGKPQRDISRNSFGEYMLRGQQTDTIRSDLLHSSLYERALK